MVEKNFPGLQVVNRGNDGKIKQDYHRYVDPSKGKVTEVDKLKKEETLE